jgi:V8-like Glu-specific endopeptidase
MRIRLLRLLGIFLIGTALGVQERGGAQELPLHSVFQVLVMNKANGRAVAAGTGFFIDSDGTALTSSHVVYPARARRSGYEALAVVNREFYGVEIRCASDLPYDPMKSAPHGAGRDVAEIRLTEPSSAFDELVSSGVHVARRHTGRLPKFPWLTLGNDPAVGDSVRILGFGNLASPLPYEWSATGRVRSIEWAPDGTPMFHVTFTRKTEPGHSGAPVLNLRDQVVGIHAWHLAEDPTLGLAIGGSALRPACR